MGTCRGDQLVLVVFGKAPIEKTLHQIRQQPGQQSGALLIVEGQVLDRYLDLAGRQGNPSKRRCLRRTGARADIGGRCHGVDMKLLAFEVEAKIHLELEDHRELLLGKGPGQILASELAEGVITVGDEILAHRLENRQFADRAQIIDRTSNHQLARRGRTPARLPEPAAAESDQQEHDQSEQLGEIHGVFRVFR